MRYNYRKGAKKQTGGKWLVLPAIGVISGMYLLFNAISPVIPTSLSEDSTVARKLIAQQPKIDHNRLYVPKINVDVAIVPIEGNEATALEKGAINRAPTSGNPKDGGNYVLAAHRFNLGLTPSQTRAKSPFYHIDKLKVNDELYVDYDGVRYAYEVVGKKLVESNAIEIENRTDTKRLTVYSCELAGPTAGREVIIAEPKGVIVWADGKPKLKSL